MSKRNRLRKTFWLGSKDYLSDNISVLSKRIPFNSFSDIKSSLRIVGTSLVTTWACERSFSAIRRLKTYARGTTTSERLNDIALMHVYQVPDIEKFTDLFSTKNRRLIFTWNAKKKKNVNIMSTFSYLLIIVILA